MHFYVSYKCYSGGSEAWTNMPSEITNPMKPDRPNLLCGVSDTLYNTRDTSLLWVQHTPNETGNSCAVLTVTVSTAHHSYVQTRAK